MGRQWSAWGWHRLDHHWARRLVTDAAIGPGELVIDAGAGDGVITAALLEAGARVVAVELHPRRLRVLRERFAGDITVVRADIADLRLPRRPFHVVANPPFAATSPLLRRLLAPGSRLLSAHLVLQHQAALRWARPDAPGARRWAGSFAVTTGRRVPRSAFDPRARVDATVLQIRRR